MTMDAEGAGPTAPTSDEATDRAVDLHARAVQAAGAVGLIVLNTEEENFVPSAPEGDDAADVAIPVVCVSAAHAELLLAIADEAAADIAAIDAAVARAVDGENRDALDDGDDIIFMHAVRPGSASRSYGLAVAQLAGIPVDVVARAKQQLEIIESRVLVLPDQDAVKQIPLFDDQIGQIRKILESLWPKFRHLDARRDRIFSLEKNKLFCAAKNILMVHRLVKVKKKGQFLKQENTNSKFKGVFGTK